MLQAGAWEAIGEEDFGYNRHAVRVGPNVPMSYMYDVFVSYSRHGEWPKWVKDTFLPLFYHWLGEELGRKFNIFVDYQIETGDSWPQKLGDSLGRTRVLVALFSKQYFNSPWCMRELQHVLSREEACGFRTAQNPGGLIVPAYIFDGEDFPHQVRHIQAAQLQKYTSVRLSTGSLTEERLSDEIRAWVPSVAHAIGSAPVWDSGWTEQAATALLDQFDAAAPAQTPPPGSA
jgi:hypothetical protein